MLWQTDRCSCLVFGYHVDMESFVIAASLLSLSLSVQGQEQQPVSVPPGAQRVTMLTLSLSASCSGDIDVHGITVLHKGMGAIRDIASVYAMRDGQRISRGRALSSADGSASLSFRPALTVPSCETADIVIMADFSVDALTAGEHRITVEKPEDIDAGDATVTLQQSSSIAPVRTTTGVQQGSMTAEFLPLLTRVTYGDHRTVARLRLSVEGSYNQVLDAITLTNDGSARNTDLQHLTLETSRGQVLASLASLRGYLAPFVLSTSFSMERGQVFLLTVRADVRAGRRRTIDFTLEEPGDLVSRRAQSRG